VITIRKLKLKKAKLAELEQKANPLEEAIKNSDDEILAKAIQDMLKKDKT